MKKLLLFSFTCFTFAARAQPTQISEFAAAIPQQGQASIGLLHLLTDKVNEKKKIGISSMLFVESTLGPRGHTSVIAAAGPMYSTENLSAGIMAGFSNNDNLLSATPWVFAQSSDRTWSGFFMFISERDKVNYLIEVLKCKKFKGIKDAEFGFGLLNFGPYLGPYARISKDKYYLGINPGFNCLPVIERSHIAQEVHQPVTIEQSKFNLHIVAGIELFGPCTRCKDIE